LADEIPQAIQWHEGMLLAPQHFQQSSCRQEMLAQYNALLVAPYCRGVRRLALDSKLLPTGTVRVLDLEAVLPDGTVVSHKPGENHELTVDVGSDESIPTQDDVLIHLALPVRNPGLKGGLLRYDAVDGASVVDENTGDGELRMPVLRPRLMLIAGKTPPPKYVSMPIAAIRFADEAWVATDYVPPAVAVPVHSPLGELCSNLARRVREKAMYVSEQVRAPSAVLDAPLMMENRLHLQSLVAGLPQFEALLATGNSHPFTLYTAACTMAGHLASLGVSLLPPVFSTYDHDNLRACFEEVIEFAIRMTNEGIPETYTAYPFKLKDRLFSLMFENEWITRRLVLGLRGPAGISERELISWADECLIGSESVIGSLRDKRIRGAQRQFLSSDPELMPVRGVVLFAVRPDAEFVKSGETLQILNFGDRGRTFSPVEIVMFVKRGEGVGL
jgi:type VI secretion system protein ImpJ